MNKKYETVHETLKQDITNGVYGPGELLPTELELTKLFNVSRPTIAKALELLRAENLIKRTAGYGTTVLESQLTQGKKIGLLIPRLGETEIFDPICTAIEQEGRKFLWQTIRPARADTSLDIAKSTEILCRELIWEQPVGVFFTPVEHISGGEEFNLSIIARLKDAGIQVVLLDRDVFDWPDQTPNDLVGIDNIQAGFVVTRHLIERRCNRFAFITRAAPAMTVNLRIMGCREALIQSGRNPDNLMVLHLLADQPHSVTEAILQHRTDGLICANDATAAILMRQLLDNGVDIPGQLKVAGFDDVKYASLLSVPLTTYRQPCEAIGRAAADTMHMRLEIPDAAPHRTTLQGSLIIRASSN
jgi:GntR family transcriptional regulator of arabinose operon